MQKAQGFCKKKYLHLFCCIFHSPAIWVNCNYSLSSGEKKEQWLYCQAVFGKSLVKHFSGSGSFSQYKTLKWGQMAQLAVKLWLINVKVIDGSFSPGLFESCSTFPNVRGRWNGQMHA